MEEIKKAMSDVLHKSKLTQKELASLTKVNEGQFSQWLRGGGALSEEKVAQLIHALLSQLKEEEIFNEFKASHGQLIEFLEGSAVYRRFLKTVWRKVPDTPVQPGTPFFVSTDAQKVLHREFGQQPFAISFVGGPKTGKSTTLLWAETVLRPKTHVVFPLDCKEESRGESLWKWIQDTCQEKTKMKSSIRLRRADQVRDWLLKDVVPHCSGKRAAIVIDHFDVLDKEATAELVITMQNIAGGRQFDEQLGDIDFILAFDEVRFAFSGVKEELGSISKRVTKYISNSKFSEAGVGVLINELIENNTSALEKLTDRVWQDFRGHPYLTQVYLHTYRGDGEDAANRAVKSALDEIFTRLRSDEWMSFFELINESKKLKLLRAPGLRLTGLVFDWWQLFIDTGFFEWINPSVKREGISVSSAFLEPHVEAWLEEMRTHKRKERR